uniref:Uncharacterized protein n=1 Tax=Oryza punctata TaxID=4537 RepID=A0A0E0LZI7_ORYPU
MKFSGDPEQTVDIKYLVEELMMTCRHSGEIANKRSGCKISRPREQDKPGVVRIGPYYHDPLNRTEMEKRAMLLELLPGDNIQKTSMLTRLLEDITALEEKARDHYADHAIRMTSKEFVEMLLLDGCYILAKFVLPHCCPGLSEDSLSSQDSDVASRKSWSRPESRTSAMRDIALVSDVFYLVDNQIPFCVLDTMHKVLHGKIISSPTPVADVLARHLHELLEHLGFSTIRVDNPIPWHLLHLLHMHFRPPTSGQCCGSRRNNTSAGEATASTVYRWRSATQYHGAGVWLKRQHLDGACRARSILDVKLDGLTLRVPSLTVDDNTCRILRNLMALEQLNPVELGSHVTAYCIFMSQLAGTASDVALLARKGIIVHVLRTDSDVAERLAALCSSVIIDLDEPTHNYLHRTRKNLERIYRSRKVNCLTLPHRNPWLVVALFTVLVMLLCQLIQAIYATMSYYQTLRGIDVVDKFGRLT